MKNIKFAIITLKPLWEKYDPKKDSESGCEKEILLEIEKQRAIQLSVGDKFDFNYFLESISYITGKFATTKL